MDRRRRASATGCSTDAAHRQQRSIALAAGLAARKSVKRFEVDLRVRHLTVPGKLIRLDLDLVNSMAPPRKLRNSLGLAIPPGIEGVWQIFAENVLERVIMLRRDASQKEGCQGCAPQTTAARNSSIPQRRQIHGTHSSCRRNRARDRNGQLQRLAQRDQIFIPRACCAPLPEINACRAHAHAVGNIGDRQAALDASIPDMTAEADFSGQVNNPFWFRVVVSTNGYPARLLKIESQLARAIPGRSKFSMQSRQARQRV